MNGLAQREKKKRSENFIEASLSTIMRSLLYTSMFSFCHYKLYNL